MNVNLVPETLYETLYEIRYEAPYNINSVT